MASVYVTFCTVGTGGDFGSASAFEGGRVATEVITSSASSARGGIVSTGNQFAQVFCSTAVYAASGPSDTVTCAAANGIYVPANYPVVIKISNGHSVAVVDV